MTLEIHISILFSHSSRALLHSYDEKYIFVNRKYLLEDRLNWEDKVDTNI